MSESNTNETKVKTKSVNSRLFKTKYGKILRQVGGPLISFLKAYHLKTRIWKMSGNGSPWQSLII